MTYITVDVELSEFDTADLIEELEIRGEISDTQKMLQKIYELRRLGKDYDSVLDMYLYEKIGRAI
jgi:hypothetical protein